MTKLTVLWLVLSSIIGFCLVWWVAGLRWAVEGTFGLMIAAGLICIYEHFRSRRRKRERENIAAARDAWDAWRKR